MGALTGAIGGLFGGVGAWAGGAIGGSVGGATGATIGSGIGSVVGGATGGAVRAAVSGGDIGMGALTGAIAGGVGFGVGWFNQEYLKSVIPEFWTTTFSGSLGGGIGAELQGGDFWEGAAFGAMGAGIGAGIVQSLQGFFSLWQSIHESRPLLRVSYTDGTKETFVAERGDTFEDFLDQVIRSGNRITSFEFNGHGTSKILVWPNDVHVTWDSRTRQLRDDRGNSINAKVRAAFSPKADAPLKRAVSELIEKIGTLTQQDGAPLSGPPVSEN
jgi:hypothetical protein